MSILCDECFHDVGLKIEAEKVSKQRGLCPHCGALSGNLLSYSEIEELFYGFFWSGTFAKTTFGGASILTSNPQNFGNKSVTFPPWLVDDVNLLERILKVGLFHHGPAMWRLGHIDPLTSLQDYKTREIAAEEIVGKFFKKNIDSGFQFFRIRKDLSNEQQGDYSQYDAPPKVRKSFGRLDSERVSVMYGSENLEICIHECKVTIPDTCFVATLETTKPLVFLDLLTSPKEIEHTPFESIDIAMKYLFSAGEKSYKLTRAIARAAKEKGYDGIIYPSYYSTVKEEKVPNLAVFGHPIKDSAVRVKCINRALLRRAEYQLQMGPIFI